VATESTFSVPKMDCPSEERMIRLALAPLDAVDGLHFDLDGRELVVVHTGPAQAVLELLEPLGYGAVLRASVDATEPLPEADVEGERRVLWQLLAINAGMFVVEVFFGVLAESTGLLADGLDMLADASVYGVSLYAVGRAVALQKRAAKASGLLQLLLALGLLAEVAHRAVVGSEPVEVVMMGVAAIALVANVGCVALLSRHRNGGVHLQASWIFTTNDVLANLGVILAGALVLWTGSSIPDLVVGAAVSLLVLVGSLRILRMAR
jgi:Co/Zn/Cd efflux system component